MEIENKNFSFRVSRTKAVVGMEVLLFNYKIFTRLTRVFFSFHQSKNSDVLLIKKNEYIFFSILEKSENQRVIKNCVQNHTIRNRARQIYLIFLI